LLRWVYKVHKWVGVAVGVVLLMWIVTGVLLSAGEGMVNPRKEPPDYAKATVSPAAALALAAAGDTANIGRATLELDQVGARAVYRVSIPSRGATLIDAANGERVTITDSIARALAARAVPGEAIQSVALVRNRERGYSGSLPAWKAAFGDAEGTWLYVGAQDGRIGISTAVSRTSRVVGGLHTFGSLSALHIARRHIRLLLIGASVVALAVVLTGYLLSLPRRRRA
jgi:hypothetical protein